jgi:hypothetical protein
MVSLNVISSPQQRDDSVQGLAGELTQRLILDGTKIEAACSGPHGWSKEYMEKLLAQLDGDLDDLELKVVAENAAVAPPGCRLPAGLAEGMSAGHALRRAKANYLNFTGIHSFSPYDEKVLAQTTLYGLPMMRIDVPESTRLALQDLAPDSRRACSLRRCLCQDERRLRLDRRGQSSEPPIRSHETRPPSARAPRGRG